MLKEKELKIDLKNNFFISSFILLLIFFIAICFYLVQKYPMFILYMIYSLIGLLFILIGSLLIKYFNLSFIPLLSLARPSITKNPYNNTNDNKHIQLMFKLFILQSKIFLLSNWLWRNILKQSALDPRFCNLLPHAISNINSNNFYTILSDIFINWFIFIGFVLIIGIFKHCFNVNNIRFAKCLLFNANDYFKKFLYNLLLGIELYLRFFAINVLFTVLLVGLFEYFSKKYELYSFLEHATLIAFLSMLIFVYFKKYLVNIIHFICRQQIFDFIKTLMIMFLISGCIIFLINQIFLKYLYFINILPISNISDYNNLFNYYNNILHNTSKFHIQILFMGLNFMFIVNAINDFTIKKFHFCKISDLCLMSLLFPIFSCFFMFNYKLNQLLQNIFTQDIFNIIMFFIIIYIFNADYKKIHHLLCFFKLNILKNNMQKKIKFNYIILINKLLVVFWMILIFYYNFIYIAIENFVTIGILFGLLIMIALIAKIFWLFKRYDIRQLTVVA